MQPYLSSFQVISYIFTFYPTVITHEKIVIINYFFIVQLKNVSVSFRVYSETNTIKKSEKHKNLNVFFAIEKS